MMFRSDILWIIPAILVAFYELKFIWAKMPLEKEEETELKGNYTETDKLKLTYLINLCYGVFLLQLVFVLFPITASQVFLLILRLAGYLLIASGFLVAKTGLKNLGQNWSGMDKYRIKQNQRLVTSGVYKFIRHPIYLAVVLEVAGFELVANSYLFIPFVAGSFWVFYEHIIKEEALLVQKFGPEYQKYKKQTKALIPFIY